MKSYTTISCVMFIILFNSKFVYSQDTAGYCENMDFQFYPQTGINTLLGSNRQIQLYLKNYTFYYDLNYLSIEAKPSKSVMVSFQPDSDWTLNETFISFKDFMTNKKNFEEFDYFTIDITSLKPGRVVLSIKLWDENPKQLKCSSSVQDYVIKVTRKVNILDDAFLYVLASAEMLTLMMLGFRIRREAVKEILVRPCALIGGVITQIIIMPLVKYISCYHRY